MRTLAELGFIVVQIDGMGTSNRSKAVHDIAFRNLADAGFPDRIRWHQAYAARAPWYDITRVGIYCTSAGGQNALAGMLFHPSFYKVAFSAAGCHDNRMDKMWWNEQWMGWPIVRGQLQHRARRQAAGQAAAGGRRIRHQRRPGLDDAGGERAHHRQPDLRPAGDPERGAHLGRALR
jgi:hypothetical protein